jgi:hypothetical protein
VQRVLRKRIFLVETKWRQARDLSVYTILRILKCSGQALKHTAWHCSPMVLSYTAEGKEMVFKSHKIVSPWWSIFPENLIVVIQLIKILRHFMQAREAHCTLQKLSCGPYPEPGESRLTLLLAPTPPTLMFLKCSLPLAFTDFSLARIFYEISARYRT